MGQGKAQWQSSLTWMARDQNALQPTNEAISTESGPTASKEFPFPTARL